MMLNESFEKNVRPRNPEKMYTSEPMSGYISTQNSAPMLYNAGEVKETRHRPVEYLPAETIALSVSECVMMLLVQLVPVLGPIMAAVWSFSPASGTVKRILARALLIVQCIIIAVVCLAWLAGLLN